MAGEGPEAGERRRLSEYRLPPGRHGIPPGEVAENQRWRLIGAAAEVLAECGPVRTTSTRVARRAGVSPATFYQHFDNVAACLLAAYRAEVDSIWEVVSAACREAEIEWSQRVGVAVASTLRLLAVEPAMAGMLGAEAPSGVASIADAREEAIERLAGLLASGRELRPSDAPELPEGAERHLVSGALAVLAGRVAVGEVERLPELAPELTEMLTAPYLMSSGTSLR
jgi:AcrR family transcriptional regulator